MWERVATAQSELATLSRSPPPLLQLSLPLSPWRDGSVESARSGPGGQDRQEAPGEDRESISDLRKHERALQKHYKLEWVASSQGGTEGGESLAPVQWMGSLGQ
jgi:hypothetical protein